MMGQAMNCKGEDRMDKNRKNGIAVVADSTLAAAVAGGNHSCVGVFQVNIKQRKCSTKRGKRRSIGLGQREVEGNVLS
jgi:hypothetical protein